MSVLYLYFREGLPIAEAKSGLSLKYGHFRQADRQGSNRSPVMASESSKRQHPASSARAVRPNRKPWPAFVDDAQR
jgi:hypothetical protein